MLSNVHIAACSLQCYHLELFDKTYFIQKLQITNS